MHFVFKNTTEPEENKFLLHYRKCQFHLIVWTEKVLASVFLIFCYLSIINTIIIIWSISYTQCSQSNSIIVIHIINSSKRIYATFFPEMKGNMLIQKAFLKKDCKLKIFSKLDNLKLKRRTRSKVQSLKNKCHPSSWCAFWAVIFFFFSLLILKS